MPRRQTELPEETPTLYLVIRHVPYPAYNQSLIHCCVAGSMRPSRAGGTLVS